MNPEMETKVLKMMTDIGEVAQKMENLDRQIVKNIKDTGTDIETLRQHLNKSIQAKADYRDFENMMQRLHAKVDLDKFQNLSSELRHEMATTINQSKKDSQSTLKKKEDNFKQIKIDIENQ
jgi:type VI protein secretion system component VasK